MSRGAGSARSPHELNLPPVCSGVRFLVHKANLAVSSTVFADMFDTASHDTGAQLPIVELQENAEILERLLPYCYPSVSPVWEFDAAKDLEFLRAVDKYMVSLAFLSVLGVPHG